MACESEKYAFEICDVGPLRPKLDADLGCLFSPLLFGVCLASYISLIPFLQNYKYYLGFKREQEKNNGPPLLFSVSLAGGWLTMPATAPHSEASPPPKGRKGVTADLSVYVFL